jgi:hypothetical protein
VAGSFIETTVGPTHKRVIDLATVKTELGIADSSQDTKLTRLIDATTAQFAGASGLRREFWRRTVQETSIGTGGEFLFLENWPLESVTSITEAGTTVTASEYSIEGWRRDRVYRDNGWSLDLPAGYSHYTPTGNEEHDTVSTYVGGWVMPETMQGDWAAANGYTVGQFVRSTSTSDLFLFECTVAGDSDATEPTWPTTEGGTVVDNEVTWTARPATELPGDLKEAALGTAVTWFRSNPTTLPSGISEIRLESASVRFQPESGSSPTALPRYAQSILRQYR